MSGRSVLSVAAIWASVDALELVAAAIWGRAAPSPGSAGSPVMLGIAPKATKRSRSSAP
jgi:hypothetical protein